MCTKAQREFLASSEAQEMREQYPPLIPRAQDLRAGLPATPEEFEARYGIVCWQDDLVRLHCAEAGIIGHWNCGECPTHKRPATECACAITAWMARPSTVDRDKAKARAYDA